MNILICAATPAEIAPLVHYLQPYRVDSTGKGYKKGPDDIRICLTGAGSAHTAYQVGKCLSMHPCDFAVQAGIAGAFSREVPIGSLWRVKSDVFADLGAEDDDRFMDLFALGLLQPDDFPYRDKRLPDCPMTPPALSGLPEADAITVNTVTGKESTLQKWKEKYHPSLESMEGAAFHYVCLMEKVNFAQLRSVSNYVEVRDKSKWDIPLAVTRLNDTLIRLIDTI
jgi:futalosine hydrolase